MQISYFVNVGEGRKAERDYLFSISQSITDDISDDSFARSLGQLKPFVGHASGRLVMYKMNAKGEELSPYYRLLIQHAK